MFPEARVGTAGKSTAALRFPGVDSMGKRATCLSMHPNSPTLRAGSRHRPWAGIEHRVRALPRQQCPRIRGRWVPAKRTGSSNWGGSVGPNVELTGPMRQGAPAGPQTMYRVPAARRVSLAVAGPVERRVRLHRLLRLATRSEPGSCWSCAEPMAVRTTGKVAFLAPRQWANARDEAASMI